MPGHVTGRVARAIRLRRACVRTEASAGEPEWCPSPPAVWLMAVWFGLAAGLIEVALLLGANYLHGTASLGRLQLNRHFPWLIPSAYVLIFGSLGLLPAGAAFRRSGRVFRFAFFLFGSLAAFSLLAKIPGLHVAACAALACGLSAYLVRRVAPRARRFRRLVAISLPLMVGVVAVTAAVCLYRQAPSERWAAARLPPAPAGAPNVLLVVLDTVRADHLGLYGYSRNTSPNLERLARRGVRFEHARAAAPWTLPSHASMFTGRYPHELRTFVNRPLDGTYPTLAEVLRDRGYLTAGFVANTYFCNSWYGLGRGFIHYEDYYKNDLDVSTADAFRSAELGRRILQAAFPRRNVRPGEMHHRKDAAEINLDFLQWLSGHRGRPFFAFLNYYDAHDPYVVPEGFGRHFGEVPTTPADFALINSPHIDQRLSSGKGVTPRELALVRDSYDDCIAYLDEQIGLLFDELDRRGVLENTLVIVTADHGEHLGEHRIYGHGQSLYRAEIHVPLLIVHPAKAPAGRVVEAPVGLRDLAATVVDLVGITDSALFPGRSLATTWRTAGGPADPVLSELIRVGKPSPGVRWPPALRGPMRSVVADGRTYIRNGDGAEELYDASADPGEIHDLSATDGGRPEVERLRALSRRLPGGEAPPR